MKMTEKELTKLVDDYGYAPGNYKYIPHGSEILRFIGQQVILVTFEAKEETNDAGETTEQWESTTDRAVLSSVYDFDPMTMTYAVKYFLVDKPEDVIEIRMQPEGYEFCNPQQTKKFVRFVPYSFHWRMVEDELTMERVKNLYESRKTLSMEELESICSSKNQGQILKYSNNIGAAVKLDSGKMLWIRLHTLRLKHRQGDKYGLFFSSDDGKEWSFLISAYDVVYNFKDCGSFKLLDLADYGEEKTSD